ncbi:MAG TPA: hypothetical protein VGU73_09415 [Acidimicrobiia bacterium]|nr:hypothetical protein [Acidimicrobiia bacterium]
MTTDVEVAEHSVPSETFEARLEQARATERTLIVRVMKASMVAIPICIVIWVGIVSIALAMADSGNFEVVLPMAAGIGVIAGAFFGMWWGFLRTADEFEELDRGVGHPSS